MISRLAPAAWLWLAVPAAAVDAPRALAVNGIPSSEQAPAVLPRRTAAARLEWSPVEGAREYQLRVDSDDRELRYGRRDCNPHAICLNHLEATTFSLPVRPGFRYQWWVHAADESGFSAPTHGVLDVGVRRPEGLTVEGRPAGESPKLPEGTKAAVLAWSPVAGARAYQLRVDTDDPGVGDPRANDCAPHMLCRNNVPGTEYRLPVSKNREYTWWVHAVGADGEASDATPPARFTVGEARAGGLPPPPGAFAQKGGGPSFPPGEKVLMAYHFYWYDVHTGAHTRAPDALQTHPASMDSPPFSWKSQAWFEKELADMAAAGIDVMLPVYWGFPDGDKALNEWSNGGLKVLVEAQKAVRARGIAAPRVGMFYDTSTLQVNPRGPLDLTVDADREFFWGTVRDFYSLIPPEYRARIDGRPVVVFYAADYAAKHDPGAFRHLRRRFRESFGEEPFLVPDVSWGVQEDGQTQWGASLLGSTVHGIAQIGAGADDRALHREQDHVRDRENGAYYARNWEAAAASGRNIVAIETWNEFHEGTDIAESLEFGTMYIALTHRFSNLWKGRKVDASFVPGASLVPKKVIAGREFEATITMRNTGTAPWSRAAIYRLGSQNPQDNERWGVGRVELDPAEVVPPGATRTFTIRARAPSRPGKYPFHWRMVYDNMKSGDRTWGGGWFGRTADAFTIEVTPVARSAQ
ncbi:MAG: DUF5010 domain-containing protein [Elusimicrobia bacterium]|nr:DUF5010 domain-containing protein [Elusimicrobiota bacterium]